MNDSRLDAGLRPGISTFPMKHQILTMRLSLQPVFSFLQTNLYTTVPSTANTRCPCHRRSVSGRTFRACRGRASATQRPVQHAGVRVLSAFGEGTGGGTVGDVWAGGVSTRRVSRLAEDLCGHEFSPATISAMVSKLDASLKAFAERELEESYPYVLLDARYEKVREEGSVRSRAVQIAIGIDGESRRQVLAAAVANRESEGSWTEFLSHLKGRGLRGVEYVVSDRHEGLKHAISKVLPTALWQRCCVHFLRNARDKLVPEC